MFIFSSGTCSKASPCSTPPSSPLSSPASLFSFHIRPRISAPGPNRHLQLPPSTGLPQSLLLADLATLWVWHILHPAFPNGWPLASPNCIFVNQCFFSLIFQPLVYFKRKFNLFLVLFQLQKLLGTLCCKTYLMFKKSELFQSTFKDVFPRTWK